MESMLPGTILVFIKTDWESFTRRNQLVALAEIARGYGSRVIAVNRPLCPVTTTTSKRHRWKEWLPGSQVREISENLVLASPKYWLNDNLAWRLPPFESLNVRALKTWYRRLAKQLSLPDENPLVWYYHPVQGYLGKVFPASTMIYEMYDPFYSQTGEPDETALALEPRYRSRVDCFLAVTPPLVEEYGEGYRKRAWSGNGISRKTLEKLRAGTIEIAPEMKKIPHPRVGYAGVIAERLNWKLLAKLTETCSDMNFVFIGDEVGLTIRERLGYRANVHHFGRVGQEELPRYISGFDVGLLPYHYNDVIRFANPLKFFETAAAGIPSVATEMDLSRRFPEELITCPVENAEAWEKAIRTQLERNASALRKEYHDLIEEYTWEAIGSRVLEFINELSAPRN